MRDPTKYSRLAVVSNIYVWKAQYLRYQTIAILYFICYFSIQLFIPVYIYSTQAHSLQERSFHELDMTTAKWIILFFPTYLTTLLLLLLFFFFLPIFLAFLPPVSTCSSSITSSSFEEYGN